MGHQSDLECYQYFAIRCFPRKLQPTNVIVIVSIQFVKRFAFIIHLLIQFVVSKSFYHRLIKSKEFWFDQCYYYVSTFCTGYWVGKYMEKERRGGCETEIGQKLGEHHGVAAIANWIVGNRIEKNYS
jgi:hypothetical protein